MKLNLGVYSKNKAVPKVVGPKRRIDKKAYTRKVIEETSGNNNTNTKRAFIIVLLLGVFILLGFGIWKFNSFQSRVTYTDDSGTTTVCDNILNPQCWTDAFKPTLKQTDGFTNALLVGVDTRPVGGGSDLRNTDTIMIASINHKTKKTMLISIPRDMYVDVRNNDKYCCSMKINSVYSQGFFLDNYKDRELDLLEETLERLLGITIHYKAMVNFEAVKAAVDAVNGVEIDIGDNLAVVYPEETPPYNYKVYEFKAGKQVLDGKQALVYSRFRYVNRGPVSYASDFSRAERQQQVISALKDKILSEGGNITELAQKYWGIYQTISSNVTLDGISFEDALAGFSLITDYDRDPAKIVLDPNFGGVVNGLIHHPPTDPAVGYIIEPKDKSWAAIRKEITKIWEYTDIYNDQAVVTLSNRYTNSFTTDSDAMKLSNLDAPFGDLFLITESKIQSDGVRIYDFSNGTKNKTIEYLKKFFNTDKVYTNPQEAGVSQSRYKEDIKVEFGPPGAAGETE